LKLFIKKCGQTAEDKNMITIDSLPLTTYRFATIPHDWHTIVRYDPLRQSKIIDFHVI